MNRKDRRKTSKKGVTAKDLLNIQNDAISEGINKAVNAMIACFALQLHDKWGWGMKSRLPKLLDQVNDQFDSVMQGLITVDDLLQVVRDELGINIK
jgi:hypothetical protein